MPYILNPEAEALLEQIREVNVRYRSEVIPLEISLSILRRRCNHLYIETKVISSNGMDVTGVPVRELLRTGAMHPYRITEVCSRCGDVNSYDD